MDWSALIKELGGGLSAGVNVALAFAVWTLWKRSNDLIDRSYSREREHSKELVETIKAVEALSRIAGGNK